ncbi:hypothetical protein M569_04099 [Genlisea aurea]|uniref:Uncharacterized protein n=1 Tax=Genlisea aurea TaxID=192259 RepID=S8CZY2_9LAMI|nr:hypothetical protein M569_04099 [Genlisea aurea]
MDKSGEKKAITAGLVEFLQRWPNVAPPLTPNDYSSDNNASPISPAPEVLRLRNFTLHFDSDEESCHSLDIPNDIPRGYLPVYVGPENRRFIIPTSYLSDPLFKLLLEKVEEEFGFDHGGALTIPCDIETFKYLLQCMELHTKQTTKQHAADPTDEG